MKKTTQRRWMFTELSKETGQHVAWYLVPLEEVEEFYLWCDEWQKGRGEDEDFDHYRLEGYRPGESIHSLSFTDPRAV